MEVFQAMIAKYPDLLNKDNTDKIWFSALKEVDSFISAKGKRPYAGTKDPKEKYLGHWLLDQIKD
jgi:hypothetical protein